MENYEKKYKEALEWVRDLYPSFEGCIKEDAEHFFPELKESEDEKIRTKLIENFKWFCGDYPETTKWGKDDDLLVKDIIAWLEKQDKQLNPDEVIAWLRSYGCQVDSIVADFKKQFKI